MTTQTQDKTTVNGIDTLAVREFIEQITQDPAKGMTRWDVTTRWVGGTRSDTHVDHYEIGGKRVDKDYTIRIDEPLELAGTNRHPNPQEYLLAALNACMVVGYSAVAALHGVELTELTIRTTGDIDLRGFLGVSDEVKPGYDSLKYTVRIKGSGTPEQMRLIHETVMATSPNRWNVSQPIRLDAELEIA